MASMTLTLNDQVRFLIKKKLSILISEEPEKQPEHGWEVWDGTNQDEGRAAFDGEKAFIKFVNFMEEHGDKLPKILVNVQVQTTKIFKKHKNNFRILSTKTT